MKKVISKSIILILIILVTFNSVINAKTEKVKSKDGVEIAYEVTGTGEPALVFVHGWCLDRSVWENQVKVLSARYKVITIDMAGHGQSGANRKNWTMRAFGEDIRSVVNKLKLNKVILVGHSMGGKMILEGANLLGNKVIGLVGADTYQKFEKGESADRAEGFLWTFKDNFQGSVKSYVELLFPENANKELVERIITKMTSASPKIALKIMKGSYLYDAIEGVKKIELPIISINGDKFSVKVDENLKVAKNFKLKTVPNAGHYVMLENPNRFNELLEVSVQEILKK